MTPAATRIERVQLHGDALDAARARLRLGSLLAGAELRPPGLPPAAVLCVRRVADPLPGALRLESMDARPPPDWERALVRALERALRGAARPAREAVPAAAEAVLFADRAELLACLARDASDGTAWLRWWWRDLRLAPDAGRDPVVSAWLETPEHVPAALELLAAHGDAVRFVAALAERDARALLLRVAEVHGLRELRRAVESSTAAARVDRDAASRHVAAGTPEPPWRRLVRESAERPLVRPTELLLGVALLLRRDPQLARSTSFAAATRAWLEAPSPRWASERTVATAQAPHDERAPEPPAAPLQAQRQRRRPARQDTPRRARGRTVPTERPAERTAPLLPGPARPAVGKPTAGERAPTRDPQPHAEETPLLLPAPSAVPADASPSGAAAPARPARGPARTLAAPRTARRAGRRSSRRRTALTPPPEQSPALPELVVETQLGGVFYLLNLALFLELYVDFTRPRERGVALDPWDLLTLLAPRLLDEPSPDDALWPLLARLAGRGPRERPGRRFHPPRTWRTPPDWLAPFEHDGTWRWSAARGTLRIVHPAGFAVAAMPRTQDSPHEQLARELRRLRPLVPTLRRAELPREPAQRLACWTARLAAYADARLRRALAAGPDDSLDTLLLRRRARVFVTPTHVEVALRLADLPLEVRFAGLDRTPGWIPAAGRFVALHFE